MSILNRYLRWVRGGAEPAGEEAQKAGHLFVWLTGVSDSRASSGKEDTPHTAKAHKEAATGTERNEASASWDQGSSQRGEITARKHFHDKNECFPSLTSANFIHVSLFPFILKPVHVQMHENQTGHHRSLGAF